MSPPTIGAAMSDGGDEHTPKDLLGDPIKEDTSPNRRPSRREADDALLRRFSAENRAAAASKAEAEASTSAQSPTTQSPQLSIVISLLAAAASASLINALSHLMPAERWLINPHLLTAISVIVSPVCALRPNRVTVALMVFLVLLVTASVGWALWPNRPLFPADPIIESLPPTSVPTTTPPDPKENAERKREELVKQREQDKQTMLAQARTKATTAEKLLAACKDKPRTLSQVFAIVPRCKDESDALLRAERERWFARRRDCSMPATR